MHHSAAAKAKDALCSEKEVFLRFTLPKAVAKSLTYDCQQNEKAYWFYHMVVE